MTEKEPSDYIVIIRELNDATSRLLDVVRNKAAMSSDNFEVRRLIIENQIRTSLRGLHGWVEYTDSSANAYQTLAVRTANRTTGDQAELLTNWALGIGGESGEVLEHVKKYAFHGNALDRDALAKELGDLLWYIAVMADDLGVMLGEVMDKNIAKLKARYPEGFVEGGGIRQDKE